MGGLLADVKGLDLSVLKDSGFRSFGLAFAFIVMTGLLAVKGLYPAGDAIMMMATAAGVTIAKYEYNRYQLKNLMTEKELPAEGLSPEVKKAIETLQKEKVI